MTNGGRWLVLLSYAIICILIGANFSQSVVDTRMGLDDRRSGHTSGLNPQTIDLPASHLRPILYTSMNATGDMKTLNIKTSIDFIGRFI